MHIASNLARSKWVTFRGQSPGCTGAGHARERRLSAARHGVGHRPRAQRRRPPPHLDRCLILRRFFCRRRVRFFFHFQRNIEVAFL
mmetsp:Transcript_88303/g.285194  ORF Transcript_88303/g.285194 Transcript_88303/m.285194 type:complete len:86 (+) Transcript_88303:93-350(+)